MTHKIRKTLHPQIFSPPQQQPIQQQQQQQPILQNYSIPLDGILPGGRLTHFQSKWEDITHHPWPLQIIKEGYRLQFTRTPIPWHLPRQTRTREDQEEVNFAVKKFLKAGIIEHCHDPRARDHLSPFFTLKEATKNRPILDCRRINQCIQVNHFKMEGVPALRDLIESNDYMVKIDLKDAYTVIPIHRDSRRFLVFENEGIVYQYKSLNFGLNVAPRIFSKILRYAIEPLREQGIRLVYYLDDICILHQDSSLLQDTAKRVILHLESLGFIINSAKSVLTPSHIQDYLGFQFNTKKMEIKVPDAKIKNLRLRLKQTFHLVSRSCRWVAGLMGKITAMIPAVKEALLHIRYLQRDLARSLTRNHHNWDAQFEWSPQSREEIRWWQQSITWKNGLPIRKLPLKTPAITIHTDSSETGWGVSSPLMETYGFWTEEEKRWSINVRELLAIFFALKLHGPRFQNKTLRIFTDNRTSIKYTTKEGGTASPILQDTAVRIQEICNQYHLTVIYQHIQGVKNVEADRLSRQKIPLYERALPSWIFKELQQSWGPLTLDTFATRQNKKVRKYYSYLPDPEAIAIDAFQQRWPKTGSYCYPPWKLIPRVLELIKAQKLKQVVLVTPWWPSQFWYPMILQMRHLAAPVTYQHQSVHLVAWRLSGRAE